MVRQKRKRGAPVGNQNARKHGFYSKLLTPEQQQALPTVTAIKTLDGEIGIARLKLKSIVANDPENYELLFRAFSSLRRLVKMQNDLATPRRGLSRLGAEALDRFVSHLTPQNNPSSK